MSSHLQPIHTNNHPDSQFQNRQTHLMGIHNRGLCRPRGFVPRNAFAARTATCIRRSFYWPLECHWRLPCEVHTQLFVLTQALGHEAFTTPPDRNGRLQAPAALLPEPHRTENWFGYRGVPDAVKNGKSLAFSGNIASTVT